jgi:alkylation response protein AidB-like acyl-CoA dehydrogenase
MELNMTIDLSIETRDSAASNGSPVPYLIADDAQALLAAQRLAAEFAPQAALRDSERRLPWAELDAFVASGLWGITVPREFGGAGVSNGTLAEVTATIAAADGSLGQIPQNHFYALEVLRVGGSVEQKRFFYERVLAGQRLGNALAEIGHKDFKRRTRLTRAAAGWHIDGRKFYCTGALYAHWIPTLVVAEEEGRDVTYLAFVPRDTPGVTVTDDWDGFGQRVTGSGCAVSGFVRAADNDRTAGADHSCGDRSGSGARCLRGCLAVRA